MFRSRFTPRKVRTKRRRKERRIRRKRAKSRSLQATLISFSISCSLSSVSLPSKTPRKCQSLNTNLVFSKSSACKAGRPRAPPIPSLVRQSRSNSSRRRCPLGAPPLAISTKVPSRTQSLIQKMFSRCQSCCQCLAGTSRTSSSRSS